MNDPNAIKRIDIRHTLIQQMSDMVQNVNNDENTKLFLILFTDSLIIQADFDEVRDLEVDQTYNSFDALLSKALQFRNETIADFEEQDITRVVNDSALFTLKNVVIKSLSSAAKTKVDSMIIFADKILGVSVSSSPLE